MRTRHFLMALVALSLASTVSAQPPPPRGPADVIERAREAQDAEAAAPLAAPSAMPAGHPEIGVAEVSRALRAPEVAVSVPSTDVPVGEILVEVADVSGAPAANATVRVGTLVSGGARDSLVAETDATGVARFSGLETGVAVAYRVNVPHEGATYSTEPFRLDPARGHRVRITRLPVTHDPNVLLQWMGGTFIEIKPDERLRVVQQAELINLGRETYVFPEQGLQVDLPDGFMAFQSQDLMTDQRIVPNDDGFRLEGSLPPGRVQLTWAFDLPIGASELTFEQQVPFRTYRYVVVSDAAEGLELEVDGFAEASKSNETGREHLSTYVEHAPTDPRWERLTVTLRGIPGPGPARYVAVALGLAFVALAFVLARRRTGPDAAVVAARRRRRDELSTEAAALEEAFAKEEVGPSFYERRRRELIDELAVMLAAEARESGQSLR